VVSLLVTHLKSKLVMYVSIKKELMSNRFGVLPRFASERVKRRFLISNVSASNGTLVRGEHVCRELRVERVCFRDSSMRYPASILRNFTLGHKHP
jgi:hypothetical protein